MKHGLPAKIPIGCKVLILGTMPGERSIALQQYYANPGNQFRRLLFQLFAPDLKDFAYPQLLQLLENHKIGLWNVLASCERVGSSDRAIKNPKANDFEALFEWQPQLKHIAFESKAAAALFKKLVGFREDFTYITLPSTSGLNARMSFERKLEQWSELKTLIEVME